jgi:EmrB/QacA subfamily drug resistance transporter
MMGTIGVPMLLGPALGPAVGGWLLQVADWKWVFWMNVPAGLLAIVLGLQFLRPAPRRQAEPVDIVGLLLATPGVTALIYGMIQSSGHGWGSAEVLGPIGAGAILILAFAGWELRQAHPLLDIRIFRSAGFSAAMVTNVILAIAMFGAIFLVPLYTQGVQGRGALHAGLLLAAQGVGAAVMMPLSGWLTDRYGARPVVVAGIAILAAASLFMSRVSPTTSDQTWVLLLGVRGIGMGCATMPAFSAAYAGLPMNAIARATAMFNSLQRIASSFGVALLATVAQARITYHLQAAMPGVSGGPTGNPGHLSPDLLARLQAPLTMGFADTFLLAGGLALLGLPAAVLLRRPPAREGDDRLPRSLKLLAWLLGALALTGFGLTVIVAFSIV